VSLTDRAVRRLVTAEQARRALEGREFVVPASIANLGPGFDTLAVAVQLYVRVRVTGVDTVGRNAVRSHFGAVALEGDDYVARSIRTLASREGVDYPSLDLEIASDIPMQAGLGSSAAATVAGLLLYDRLAGPREDRDLLRLAATLEGHADNVYSVALAVDGVHALSASRDKTIRLWDLASGACVRVFEGHTDVVRSVRFLKGDRWALSGSEDKTIRLWDVRTGRESWRGSTTGRVMSVAASPDGRRAIAGTYDRRVLLWDLPSG